MPLDLSQLTPEQLQALLAQNSSSASQTPDVDAALSTPTAPPAAPDRSGLGDQITDYINKAVPSSAVQNMVDQAAGKPGSMSQPDATITSQNTDLPTDVDTDSDHDTGLSPSVDAKLAAMTQPARDALAKGPDATPVPDDTDEDDEDEDESPVKGGPLAKNGPGPATAGTTAAPTGPKDYLGDMMAKLYGPGNDANALKLAMQTRNQMQLGNNLNMAGQQVAAALSRGGFKPDYAANAEMAQQANNPVNNILQQRQAQEGQIGTALKLSDFNDKAQQQDPNSPLSKAMRDTVRAYFPKMAAQPNFENQDYESIIKQQPFLDTVQKTVSNNLYRQALLQNNQNKQEATAEFNVPSKIDNYINNRGATKNAADADRRVDNINSLLAKYPNLDDMPQGQIEEFGQELHQITAGLGAHEGSTAQLMSPTLRSRLALMESKGMNNVTGAEMGAFLKENVPYLQDLQQNARAYIGDHISGQVEGAKKLIQDPVVYSKLQDYYSKYLNASQARKQTQQAVSQVAPSPKSSPIATPDDAKAVSWAKQNISNPDPKTKAMALQIIKANGG